MVCIVYLEDDYVQVELVIYWLCEVGYICMYFFSGWEFMSLLCRDIFDLLVFDWEVFDMSGYVVFGEVWVSGNKMLVLFVIQCDDELLIVGVFSQGVDDYMVKFVK